jgi:hypothetical protein
MSYQKSFLEVLFSTVASLGKNENFRYLNELTKFNYNYNKQVKGEEKIEVINEKKGKCLIYGYVNIATFEIYIGQTDTTLEKEEENIHREYEKYIDTLISKTQYEGKYDEKLLENIHEYDLEFYKIFGLFIYNTDSDKTNKMIHQHFLDNIYERYDKLLNDKSVYCPLYSEKYKGYSYEPEDIMDYIETVTEFENEFNKTGKVEHIEEFINR